MIQFNLLPDVKLEYIKTRRTKRMVTLIATIVAAASLTVMVLLFLAVNVVQKNHLDNISEDIARDSKTLQEIPDLDKILTVQNQLNSLSTLHEQKPQVTRLNGYLQQITPANVSIAELTIDFTTGTMSFTGSADNIAAVNKFVDTLKFTTYKHADGEGPAFNDVVLTSFTENEGKTNYQISLIFDLVIFDSSKDTVLVVPNTVTTRSSTDRPEALFQPVTEGAEGE